MTTLDPRARADAIDKAIEEIGIDLLRELRAIAWFCDGSSDGKHALIPSDRRHWYEPSGKMAALTSTGCIRLLSPSYCETIQQSRPALRMEQFGRQVLARARAMQLPIEMDDEPDASSPQPALAVKGLEKARLTMERYRRAGLGDDVFHADLCDAIKAVDAALVASPPPSGEEAAHTDDLAVDQFAVAMKAKISRKRAEGRGGWDDRDECSAEHLSYLLIQHCLKGDPLDVGNLAMMLHQRGDRIVIDDETASLLPALSIAPATADGWREKADPTSHASTSPGPVNCSTRRRHQGDPYPRTCERCRLGPCPFFHDDGTAKPLPAKSPQVRAEARLHRAPQHLRGKKCVIPSPST